MKKGSRILCLILICIPTLFVLFLLAMVNILLLFVGIIVLLGILMLVKKKRPDLFARKKPEKEDPGKTVRPPDRPKPKQVYMVLSSREGGRIGRITVNKESFTIGRNPGNDFVIDEPRISRHHMRIEYNSAENACYAVDMGSTGGTYLNSERMSEGRRYKLIQGDRIAIDDHEFGVDYAHF